MINNLFVEYVKTKAKTRTTEGRNHNSVHRD